MKARPLTVAAAVLGAASLGVGIAQARAASDGEPTIELLPIEGQKRIEVADLDPKQAAGLADQAVAELSSRYPELGKLTVLQAGPVYQDDLPEPIAVSAQLGLAEPADVTMDLVATIVDEQGKSVAQPQAARVTNLRGLVVQVSTTTGEIINLTPMAFMEDVDRSDDEMTNVEYLDPDQARLPAGALPEE